MAGKVVVVFEELVGTVATCCMGGATATAGTGGTGGAGAAWAMGGTGGAGGGVWAAAGAVATRGTETAALERATTVGTLLEAGTVLAVELGVAMIAAMISGETVSGGSGSDGGAGDGLRGHRSNGLHSDGS
jgi:hypothetical protein